VTVQCRMAESAKPKPMMVKIEILQTKPERKSILVRFGFILGEIFKRLFSL
jgi:hypothetical protein